MQLTLLKGRQAAETPCGQECFGRQERTAGTVPASLGRRGSPAAPRSPRLAFVTRSRLSGGLGACVELPWTSYGAAAAARTCRRLWSGRGCHALSRVSAKRDDTPDLVKEGTSTGRCGCGVAVDARCDPDCLTCVGGMLAPAGACGRQMAPVAHDMHWHEPAAVNEAAHGRAAAHGHTLPPAGD